MAEETKELKNDSIDQLFTAGAHYAYRKSRRHPSARPFIFGKKNTVEIFDLEKTKEALEEAKAFVGSVAKEGKQVLFVGNKNEAQKAIREGAESAGMPYVANRWVGGALTNMPEVRKRIKKLEEMRDDKEKGNLEKYTKKERLLIDRDIERLEKLFEGLIPLQKIPAALFVVDSEFEATAVREANRLGIPVVSISNSDCDLSKVDYPIPANDANIKSIKFFVDEIVSAYKKGAKEAAAAAEKSKTEDKDKEVPSPKPES